MTILSHRGLWNIPEEKNTATAFHNSFNLGIGTETDLRDYNGEIVISHDIASGNEMTFRELLEIMDGRNLPLALNIKADGLIDSIKLLLDEYSHTNYFTFDMSIPDLVYQSKKSVNIFTGVSDLLLEPVLLDQCKGIWLDSFYSDWYNENIIFKYINLDKIVCVVSSDLHNRNTDKQWEILKRVKNIDKLMLCTDKPLQAIEYFCGDK